MASKAYVASMTVAELTSELKMRGLSCRGKKKTLQTRLEEALEDEELSESSSDDGREATIRAASAVISQLEGDGKMNKVGVVEQEEQEKLVVSIEHSKRRLPIPPDNTSNGDDLKLSSRATIFNKNRDTEDIIKRSESSMQPIMVQPPMSVCQEENLKPSLEIMTTLCNEATQSYSNTKQVKASPVPVNVAQSDTNVELQSKDTIVKEEEASVFQPESPTVPTISISDLQPEVYNVKHDYNPIPIENDQGAVSINEDLIKQSAPTCTPNDKPTPRDDEVLPNTEQVQHVSSPIIKLPENMSCEQPSPLTRAIKSLYSASTPGKSGLLSPTVISPKDFDIESEANSIAVEPPSPNRDNVSFAVDDENTSITGSVEFMDVTPYDQEVAHQTDSGSVSNVVEDDSVKCPKEAEPTKSEERVVSTNDQVLVPQIDEGSLGGREKDGKDLDIQVGVSFQSGLVDSGPIEVDVLVPTVEEDDMSVFSIEAAEVQKLDSDVSNKVSERPSTLLKTSSDKSRSFSDSKNRTTESVGNVSLVNTTDTENCNKKRSVSVPEENRERSGTPTTKRRKISTSPKRVQERRRKWGSNVSRTPTSAHTAISSDVLESIIPDDVKEEVTENLNNMSALEAVMNYGEDDDVHNQEDGQNSEQPQGEQEKDGEMKQVVEEEDILDLGKESSMMDEYEQEWKEKEREREEQRYESQKAKQELETRRRIEARIKARQQGEEGKEKNVVRRTPSPARNPPSRILHIVNLTRPFTNIQLKDLLQEGETVLVEGGCWTDRIKSHCIAVYVSMDSAIAARNRIHNLKWPRQNPRLLKAEYITTDEVREYSNGELEIQPPSPSTLETESVTKFNQRVSKETASPPKTTDDHNRQSTKENVHVEANRKQRLSSTDTKTTETEKEEKPKSVLDNLFRKTTATPPIYWLPLSEKEASEKEAERKSIEAEREKRREERRKERDLEDMLRDKKLKEAREHRAREKMRRRDRSRSRSQSPRSRRHSPSPRRRSPVRRGYSPRRSRSPVRRRHSKSDSGSPIQKR